MVRAIPVPEAARLVDELHHVLPGGHDHPPKEVVRAVEACLPTVDEHLPALTEHVCGDEEGRECPLGVDLHAAPFGVFHGGLAPWGLGGLARVEGNVREGHDPGDQMGCRRAGVADWTMRRASSGRQAMVRRVTHARGMTRVFS